MDRTRQQNGIDVHHDGTFGMDTWNLENWGISRNQKTIAEASDESTGEKLGPT